MFFEAIPRPMAQTSRASSMETTFDNQIVLIALLEASCTLIRFGGHLLNEYFVWYALSWNTLMPCSGCNLLGEILFCR